LGRGGHRGGVGVYWFLGKEDYRNTVVVTYGLEEGGKTGIGKKVVKFDIRLWLVGTTLCKTGESDRKGV